MKILIATFFFALSLTAVAQAETASTEFKTIFFDNGNTPLISTERTPTTLKDFYLDSVFSGLSVSAPSVNCKSSGGTKTCDIQWLSAKYLYVRGEKPNDVWRQQDDCVRAVRVELKGKKVTSAEIMAEMCGW